MYLTSAHIPFNYMVLPDHKEGWKIQLAGTEEDKEMRFDKCIALPL